MDIDRLKEIIESNYCIDIHDIEKIKNTYKLKTKDCDYCIKIIKYDFPHFLFIISAIKYLQKRGFKSIPQILKTKNDSDYINLNENFAYLTEWIPARESNYDNPVELIQISKKIGELHTLSSGFNLTRDMNPRIGWYKWIKVFETRCDEILDFKKRISQKANKSEFDHIYLENINNEIERGQKAIEGLKRSHYISLMDKEVLKMGFCHHDLAHHNILVDKNNELNIIDFDYCILDTHLHDLASLLIRVMKDGKWSTQKANLILNAYCITNNVFDEELSLIKEFIRFPQGFWQIGLQYYWEMRPWEESVFINRIKKYIEDIGYREEFLNEYFR
ncbi:CotS family spore coat protein [Clostridium celatum]|uniref:CotS family spore coat protein n=1 Tax=Clostridium celatum TaxID=36834 RepID=UPI00319DD4A4